jgi:post-segregation antitoxin (ccd killing protein)
MPKRKTHGKTSISLPLDLLKPFEPRKDRINLSALAASALEAELNRLESEEKEREFYEKAKQEASDPVAQRALIERHKLAMPPSIVTEYGRLRPHEQAAAMNGWTAGTADAFRQLTSPPLPFEYVPGQK